METVGQKITTAIVDITFFLVVGFLGVQKVLESPSLFAILIIYSKGRFDVARDKQTAQIISNNSNGPGGGGSGTGSSGSMRAVDPNMQSHSPHNLNIPKSKFAPPIPRDKKGILAHLPSISDFIPKFHFTTIVCILWFIMNSVADYPVNQALIEYNGMAGFVAKVK